MTTKHTLISLILPTMLAAAAVATEATTISALYLIRVPPPPTLRR
jgi:hypothetical protein